MLSKEPKDGQLLRVLISDTDRVVQSREVFVVILLQPVIEVLGVIGRISLSVRRHTEDGQGVFNLRETRQLRLQGQTNVITGSKKANDDGHFRLKPEVQLELSYEPVSVHAEIRLASLASHISALAPSQIPSSLMRFRFAHLICR